MTYRTTLQRIRRAVAGDAYLVPTEHLEPEHRQFLLEISREIASPDFDAAEASARVHAGFECGVLDKPMLYSALGVIAASPQVADYREAHRLASLQEMASLELGGSALGQRLASVERHRGVLAFLMRQYEVALEAFTRALERERSAENLANILSTLLALREVDEAGVLLATIRRSFPDAIRERVEDAVRTDADLRLLRDLPGL